MSYPLSVITPEGKAFEGTVDSVAAIGLYGGFEVYTNHAAMLTALKPGKLRIRKEGHEQTLNVGSGVLEVMADHQVLVLVDSATV